MESVKKIQNWYKDAKNDSSFDHTNIQLVDYL